MFILTQDSAIDAEAISLVSDLGGGRVLLDMSTGKKITASISFQELLALIPCVRVDSKRAVPHTAIASAERTNHERAEVETKRGNRYVVLASFEQVIKALDA